MRGREIQRYMRYCPYYCVQLSMELERGGEGEGERERQREKEREEGEREGERERERGIERWGRFEYVGVHTCGCTLGRPCTSSSATSYCYHKQFGGGVPRALTKHLWCKLLRAMNHVSFVHCEN